MGSDLFESDALSRTRTYEPPPEGFDPLLTASAKELRRCGLPRAAWTPTRSPNWHGCETWSSPAR